jgi:Protein of unknown function (DUF2934)
MMLGRSVARLVSLFDRTNKTNLGRIVSGWGKMQIMQSGKSPKKAKKSAGESPTNAKVMDAHDTPKKTTRVSKPPAADPAPAKEAGVVKAKSVTPKSSRPARAASLHRAAKPVIVVAEPAPERAKVMAAAAGAEQTHHISHDAIAKLAHSYWVARGHQGGNPHEDWIRAERELRSRR